MDIQKKVFNAVCDFFNSNNIMTIEDFNNICDSIRGNQLNEQVIQIENGL